MPAQILDGISFEMKEPFDFSFLHRWGKVFKVYDDQDSGNICFGTDNGSERFFVKFAGAPTKRSCVSPETAVENLKATVSLYRTLAHPNLIELLSAGETAGGFAMVFRWVDAECMGKMYPESRAKFMTLTPEERLGVFSEIQSFFAHIAFKKHVAIDFYDGSIMYDFINRRTVICDIDFFSPQPCINTMGRMWGSSRFMSPEEFELGAAIDEITNVYTLGATAFALFSDSSRDRGDWPLSDRLHAAALRAVQSDRSLRPQSIAEFIAEWSAAC